MNDTLVSTPAALFQGYGSVLGGGRNTVVTGDFTQRGASNEVRCSVCTTTEELARSLEIDQSLSIGLGPVGNVGEKVKFVASLKTTTNSVSVVVFARHTIGTSTVTSVRLKDGVAALDSDEKLRDFVRCYGDSFLSEVTEGGEYYAVYTFYSQTREQQFSLVSSLQANGIFNGVTVGGSLQVAMSNFLKTTNVRYSFEQRLSGIKNAALPEPQDCVAFALKFPSLPLDAPVLIGISASGYEMVPGIGGLFRKVVDARNHFTGNSVVGGLVGKLVKLSEIEAQISWIKNTHDFYGGYDDAALTRARELNRKDIHSIHDQMSAYDKDPLATFPELEFKSLEKGTPVLSYSISTTAAWGGGGGRPFSDVPFDTYIQMRTRIAAIKLRTGRRVDQIAVTYEKYGTTHTYYHGGDGGTEGNTLQLLPRQFVTKVQGRSGTRIDQLAIEISGGGSVSGGVTGGSPFTWSVPPGNFVLGFQGRCGSELDCLQVCYAQFNPSEWIPVVID